jgi:hypothetical protein
MVIEELTAIVRMELPHRERQAVQNVPKSIFHNQVTASQGGATLTPAAGHIDHLQGARVFTRSDRTGSVSNCV